MSLLSCVFIKTNKHRKHCLFVLKLEITLNYIKLQEISEEYLVFTDFGQLKQENIARYQSWKDKD